ncbi:MAG: hypothetical protein GWO24_32455, partial [Akkermansiaceae bacterium]|nr:hypothetical protein [Akkermansiaceae bacterium]
ILEKKVEERKRELIGLRRAGAGDTEAVTLLKELIVPLQRFRDSVDGTIQTVERL